MGYIVAAVTIVYYIAYPIFYLLNVLLSTLLIITSPLVHIAHYIGYACWYPIHLLGKLETMYIFLGVAVVVGALTGTSLHYASGFIVSILRLTPEPAEEARVGRPLATHRVDRRQTEGEKDPFWKFIRDGAPAANLISSTELSDREWMKEERGRSRSGLIPNTILEEDDSSEYGL